MNPELNPNYVVKETENDPSVTGGLRVSLTEDTPSSHELCGGSLDSDPEGALIAKAQTLMIDLPGRRDDTPETEPIAETTHYVQGVIQGQRIYLITNLLGESEVLLQPQMVWTIGRNRDAALPLKDRALSRRHAVLLYTQNVGFQLIDLNSMNGSFVNGNKIQQRQVLKDGDRIRLGSVNFTFFVSKGYRSLGPIHPEVLARFNTNEPRSSHFIDYSALEDPEILFKPKARE
jgi:pSer/pThr/pTyr-binding forkhead associated (FHA) protein